MSDWHKATCVRTERHKDITETSWLCLNNWISVLFTHSRHVEVVRPLLIPPFSKGTTLPSCTLHLHKTNALLTNQSAELLIHMPCASHSRFSICASFHTFPHYFHRHAFLRESEGDSLLVLLQMTCKKKKGTWDNTSECFWCTSLSLSWRQRHNE